tara:strand:- start:311 stop:2104 length:1794 start_codon:yes stop_codon:yes gene_type:complete
MATYKEIQGFAVQNFSQDPVPTISGWTAGGNLSQARFSLAGSGTQTAALAFGGRVPPGNTHPTSVEEYGGATWTSGGALGTGRATLGGAGTQTAGLAFGGFDSSQTGATEEYDGSSWTSGGALGTARSELAGTGTQTAGLAFGGENPGSGGIQTATEEYDGSSWTSGGALPAARAALGGAGIQTAALAYGGTPPINGASYEYDGSSWTAGGTMGSARTDLAGSGLQTAAIGFGGATPSVTVSSEAYDGSSWSATPSLATARKDLGGAIAAPSTLSLAFGGGPPESNATEEFSSFSEPSSFQTDGQVFYNDTEFKFKVTSATSADAWASGTNLPEARNEARGTGTDTNSGIVFGGTLPSGNTGTTYQYDGSSWTARPSMNTARGLSGEGSAGTIASALVFGGESQTAATEEFDGSAWSNGGNMNTARYTLGGAGTQTAGLGAGGYVNSGGVQTACEEYDGSSWTNVTGLPSGANALSGVGPQTAALMGGNTFNEYDGTNWTSGGTPANPAGYKSVAGVQTNAVTVGGNPPSSAPTTEKYNGTSFSTSSATLNTGRYVMGSWGTAAGFGVAGGTEPSRSNKTEEFTGSGTLQIEDIDVT